MMISQGLTETGHEPQLTLIGALLAALPGRSRAQQAAADATLILQRVATPSGAVARSSSPVPSSPLSTPPQYTAPGETTIVAKPAWWLVPGSPRTLLAWEAAHLSKPYQHAGEDTGPAGVDGAQFSLPAVPGVFSQRTLYMSAVSAGHGQTAVRLDAVVDWIPPRAAGDTIPATAAVAQLTESKGGFGNGHPPSVAAATVTSAKQVAALAAYLNRLQVNEPGPSSCPADSGGALTITFRATASGPVLARATAALSGCAFISYAMPGQPTIGIGGGDAGRPLLTEVNRVTGLNWKMPAGIR